MTDAVSGLEFPSTVPATSNAPPRHTALIRVTHWITMLSLLALLVTGIEILISHPRFYWGEAANVSSPALFSLPIPASRPDVPTGYDFVLPDQNGWSRSLHFQAGWILVLNGLFYRDGGIWTLDTSVMAGLADCLLRLGSQAIVKVGFEGLQDSHFRTAKQAPNPIPHPASQEFFEYYTESAYSVLLNAYLFRQAIDVDWSQNKSLDACNGFMAGVSTQFRFEKGQPVQEPAYASLLAAFADMAMRDVMAGLRLGRCECCGQMLVTNYERTKYCSVQCRWRVVKQRSRSKAAEKGRKKDGRKK